MSRCFCPCHTHPGTYPPPCGVCGHDTREGRMVGGYRDGWEPNETEDDAMSWIDAEMSRLKGEIRVLTRERDDAKRQALLFVVADLRQAAEAHMKSAAIEGRRLYRKHLYDTAEVLIERAKFYEQSVAGKD